MRLERGELAGGRVARAGTGPFDALLVSRLDVDVQVFDIPPISDRDLEGLVRYKLRSRYPGNPRQTSFDYRVAQRGKIRRVIVFVARTSTVEAYRAAAAGARSWRRASSSPPGSRDVARSTRGSVMGGGSRCSNSATVSSHRRG